MKSKSSSSSRASHDNSQTSRVGCTLVEHNSWPSAPASTIIIGLKELPVSTDPIAHTHIQFAHCYKNQAGWASVLTRFGRGGGTLYDIEFLTDDKGRRVAAFGFHAGFAGAAAGALAVAAQKSGKKLGGLKPYENEAAMVKDVKEKLGGSGKGIKALVIGALGRCGRGAVDLFRKIGLEECVRSLRCLYSLLTDYVQRRYPQVGLGRDRQGRPFPRNSRR
jgi:saccharopine dehydrogenase (NAD+, L-lysine forming)